MSENKDNLEYLEPEDLFNIINIIRDFEYEHKEEVPDYDAERNAIDEYFALIERSKTYYYSSIFDKASYIFININSHYFSNGNKRLSVASTVYFLEKNNYVPAELSKTKYKQLLQGLFNNPALSDWDGFSPENFGLYNLALIVAKHNEKKYQKISSDDLKDKVKTYFQKTFTSK